MRFDVWDEEASEPSGEFGETNNARRTDESDFEYTQHPLVVSFDFKYLIVKILSNKAL